jgi:osmotically-inducible protein OsmY
MLKRSVAQTIAMAFVMTLFLAFNAAATGKTGVSKKAGNKKTGAAQTGCSRTTDAALVQAVKEKLSAEFQARMSGVNVSSKKRVVRLEGWLGNKAAVDKAVAIAKKTRCVKTVISKLEIRKRVGCGAGQKPCGDTCIDKNSACNITIVND